MKKRLFGYAAWLLMTACLYFFENNTGTRVILSASALIPLIPILRMCFFTADRDDAKHEGKRPAISRRVQSEETMPDETRPYIAGDPIRSIHWKLSAKKDELIVRSEKALTAEEKAAVPTEEKTEKAIRSVGWLTLTAALIPLLMLWLVPSAQLGLQAICNRLFAASEAVNAYVYERFPVSAEQSMALAAGLIAMCTVMIVLGAVISKSRVPMLCVMLAVTVFQVYFGLSFPAAINIPLYGLASVKMMSRPLSRKRIAAFGLFALAVTLAVMLILSGVDTATEDLSEAVRDRLSMITEQFSGGVTEENAGDIPARHVFTQSLVTGENKAQTMREFRLETIEEELISMPHWVNYLKIVLLLLLSTVLMTAPFLPFMILNARKKRMLKEREIFESENVSEAVCAVFQEVIRLLEMTGHDAGNTLYREWAEKLPSCMAEGYAERFAACAESFERACYSSHMPEEEKRREALSLLRETRDSLYAAAGRRQRFYMKYWMCV